MLQFGVIPLPEMNPVRVNARYYPHPHRVRTKARVIQKPAQKKGRVIHTHIQPDQTIPAMTQLCVEKILILREQRHPAPTM